MAVRTLLCAAYPFGYGPAAKLLHLAPGLTAAGFRLVFAGTGIARELAARSDFFDDVIATAAAGAVVRDAVGVLSLMDREMAALAAAENRPLFVADSLLWMRTEVPPAFRSGRRVWAQRFDGSAVPTGVVEVGPILAPPRSVPRDGPPVVNLGGSATPAGEPSDYFDAVARWLPGVIESAVVLAGAGCAAVLRERLPAGFEVRSLPHGATVDHLAAAPWVLTCPGLTATLECFQHGTPTYFLPPQNYSQWLILDRLRSRGLADGAFHWADVLPAGTIPKGLPEAGRGERVSAAIRRAAADPRAESLFRAGFDPEARDVVPRQRAFFDSLGPNGADQIVAELDRLV